MRVTINLKSANCLDRGVGLFGDGQRRERSRRGGGGAGAIGGRIHRDILVTFTIECTIKK